MLKLATTNDEILEFEQLRTKVFSRGKELDSLEKSPYARHIKNGDLLAFQCLKEGKQIGGMLLATDKNNIKIHRLFVEEKERSNGAGSFMLDYVYKHKEFFEDYYGLDLSGIIMEPLNSSVDFYFNNGYDYSGFQMYKQYEKRK